MMNCHKIQCLVTDYFEQTLDYMVQKRFEFHLALCPSCKRHVEKMRHLVNSLGSIPSSTEVPEETLRHFDQWIAERENDTKD